jgi:tellurite resistance-related uncharacterized protein
MKTIPNGFEPYKKTPIFDESTVPAGLLKAHKTKAGTWGKIVVLEGGLKYLIQEPEVEMHSLNQDVYGVVEPGILHEVQPLGKVKFYVEFYRAG